MYYFIFFMSRLYVFSSGKLAFPHELGYNSLCSLHLIFGFKSLIYFLSIDNNLKKR